MYLNRSSARNELNASFFKVISLFYRKDFSFLNDKLPREVNRILNFHRILPSFLLNVSSAPAALIPYFCCIPLWATILNQKDAIKCQI